jgi:hypothetical protein
VGTQPRLRLLAAAVALLVGLAGCGETDDQRAARATVTRFYEALKRGDAAAACRLVATREQKQCVPAVKAVFRRAASSPDPNYFDELPDVGAADVEGDTAKVTVRRGGLRRHVSLERAADGWRISGSPESS